jgi:hypothetical protein
MNPIDAMASAMLEDNQQAPLVTFVTRALTLANAAAVLHGTEPAISLISIAQESSPSGTVWRVDYVKRDGVNRRGGFVDDRSQAIQKVLRGQ